MLKVTRLIQRLSAPTPGSPNPHAFGCGYRYGGLSEEGARLFAQVASFEYMGAAEYEFGAVANTMKEITTKAAEYDRLVARSAYGSVFVFAPKVALAEVEERIRYLAEIGGTKALDIGISLRDLSHLLRSLREKAPRTCGWLELDNHFFFTINAEMMAAFVALVTQYS